MQSRRTHFNLPFHITAKRGKLSSLQTSPARPHLDKAKKLSKIFFLMFSFSLYCSLSLSCFTLITNADSISFDDRNNDFDDDKMTIFLSLHVIHQSDVFLCFSRDEEKKI